MATTTSSARLAREQDRFFASDDVSEYAGQWIAVRDGQVVAAAADIEALQSDPAVQSGDALSAVPVEPDAAFLF